MGSSPTVGFGPVSLVIKDEILRAVSLKNYVIWVAFENSTQPLIIHREVGSVNSLVPPKSTKIGMLQDEEKIHCQDFVPTLVHAYNCTKSNAMEFSPYYLMFHKSQDWGLTCSLDC